MKKFFKSKKSIFGVQVADWLLLALGLAVFVAIALFTITKSSIWFDEAFSSYLIRFNFWDIAKYTAADVHPPLYYWILKLWSLLFGNTDFALRSMSVFFSGVAIIFGYLLIHRLFNKKAARISLIFIVLSPMIVRYSQEMRMYTLVAAIALAATYTLTFAVNSKKRTPWIIYGILVSLGMWTHYFSALIWITHWIWRADVIRRTIKKTKFIKSFFSREWILAHVVAIGLYIPWTPFLINQITTIQVNGFWIPAVTPDTVINFLTNTFYYLQASEITGWLAMGFIVTLALMSWLAFKVYKLQNDQDRQSYRLIMMLAFVPLVLLLLASMPPLRPSFVDRYLIPSTFFIYLFIGLTLTLSSKIIKTKLRAVVIVIIALSMTIGVANVWYFGNYAKTANPPASNNAKEIVQAIVNKSGDNQPIIADSPWLFYEAVSYSTDKHPVYFIDANTGYRYGSLDMLKYNDQHKIKDLTQFTKENPIVWYVGLPRGADFSAPYSNWKVLQKVYYNDSINGKPAYEAIQYEINK